MDREASITERFVKTELGLWREGIWLQEKNLTIITHFILIVIWFNNGETI